MTYEEFLSGAIARAQDGARAVFDDQRELAAAIAALESCRRKTPEELVALWRAAQEAIMPGKVESETAASAIEWICDLVSVGATLANEEPLLPKQPTDAAKFHYAEIVQSATG
jgi:hypothetical protein